ncbi:MAG: bifunctional diguanylate cyclase/phosphodiesterase [Sporichthyaceae bacterium]
MAGPGPIASPAAAWAPRPVAGAVRGWWFWGWIALNGLIALVVLGEALGQMAASEHLRKGAPLALIAGLVLIAELRPVVTAGSYDPQGVTVSTAFVFAILVTWGPWPALLVHGTGVLLGEIAKRKQLWRVVFNTGQYLVSLCLAAGVLWVFDMQQSLSHPIAAMSIHQLPILALAWGAYFLSNLAFVATAISLREGTPWWDDFTDEIGYYAVTTFAVLALSPLVVVVTIASWQLIPLLLLPLFLVYKTASISREKEQAALHDALTGLANRKRLVERMADAGEVSLRSGRPMALCLLDLDRFKEINDTLGHHTGDRLLEIAANRLARAVRPEDTVARLGGDEFAVLLTDVTDAESSVDAAQRLRAVLTEPYHLDGMTLQVETSIGVAIYPEHTDNVPRLLQLADVAMYQAKDERTGVELYRPERDIHTPDRLDLLGSLRRGIENDELVMHFQPTVAFPGGRPVGVEALVRWDHPDRGLIYPDAFLDLVEQSGMMRQLTHIALAKSLAQVATWWRSGIELTVSVNVSVRDLTDTSFATVVADLLEANHLPARALKLEITEHVLMADPGRMTAALESMDRLGVDLSLDDFGTGYSSLVHLKRLPVSEIKVDRSFVQRMTSDADDAVIVRSIIDLAHSLGLRVVAEGVETMDTWRALEALGCDLAQGYLISRPLPGDLLTYWLAQHFPRSTDADAAPVASLA